MKDLTHEPKLLITVPNGWIKADIDKLREEFQNLPIGKDIYVPFKRPLLMRLKMWLRGIRIRELNA